MSIHIRVLSHFLRHTKQNIECYPKELLKTIIAAEENKIWFK